MRWEIIHRFGAVSIVGAFVGSFAQLSLRPGAINWKTPPIIDMAGGFLSGLIGMLIGSRILPQVSSELFNPIILVAVLLMGILMLLGLI